MSTVWLERHFSWHTSCSGTPWPGELSIKHPDNNTASLYPVSEERIFFLGRHKEVERGMYISCLLGHRKISLTDMRLAACTRQFVSRHSKQEGRCRLCRCVVAWRRVYPGWGLSIVQATSVRSRRGNRRRHGPRIRSLVGHPRGQTVCRWLSGPQWSLWEKESKMNARNLSESWFDYY